jgi:uncharacterized protein
MNINHNQVFMVQKGNSFIIINRLNSRWAVTNRLGFELLKNYDNLTSEENNLLEPFFRDKILTNESERNAVCPPHPSLFVLHSTDDCSLFCDYCYAGSGKSRKKMSPETGKKVIDRVVEFNPSIQIGIEFHGGEPTMNLDLISSVLEYGDRFSLKNGRKMFRYTVQSNGINFTEDFFDLLKRRDFNLGISLDGPREYHDLNRKYASGRGSFDDVFSTIQELQLRKIGFGTICVVKDPSVLACYPDFMVRYNISSVKFNPYFNQGRAKDFQLDVGSYSMGMLGLFDRLVELNNIGGRYNVSDLSILVRNLIREKRDYMCMRFPCGAGSSMLSVGVSGEVYPCEEMNGNNNLVLGNIFNESINEIINKPLNLIIKRRRLEDISECRDCFASNYCLVSCANRSYSISKDFNTRTTLCEYYKYVIPEIMLRIYKDPSVIKCLM